MYKNETTPLVKKAVIADSEAPLEQPIHRLPSFRDDIFDTIVLGVPIFISMLSWVGVSLCAFFGHVELVTHSCLTSFFKNSLW